MLAGIKRPVLYPPRCDASGEQPRQGKQTTTWFVHAVKLPSHDKKSSELGEYLVNLTALLGSLTTSGGSILNNDCRVCMDVLMQQSMLLLFVFKEAAGQTHRVVALALEMKSIYKNIYGITCFSGPYVQSKGFHQVMRLLQ